MMRCPRCRSTNLTATEITEALMQFRVRPEGITRVTHSDEFGDVIGVTMECAYCGHQWKPRSVRQMSDLGWEVFPADRKNQNES